MVTASPPSGTNGGLNARLKTLTPPGSVDYTPRRVQVGDPNEIRDRIVAAYEGRLAPPAAILAKTFGILYERRTLAHPDSIAYVFETYQIGPLTMCKAFKVVEHPAPPAPRPAAASAADRGAIGHSGAAALDLPGPERGAEPEVGIVQFPCTERSYRHVPVGSIATPLPRHPDADATPPGTLAPTR